MGEAHLAKAILSVILAAVLVLPASGQPAQQVPLFITEVRTAVVRARGTGVLVLADMVMTHAHGFNPPGRESALVTFYGLHSILDPEGFGHRITPDELTKRGRVLCTFPDVDLQWVQLMEPAPEGAVPVKLGHAFVHPFYIVGATLVHRAAYIGDRSTVNSQTGAMQRRPGFEVRGASVVPGWSGLPVVNGRGEVVGLVSGASSDGSVAILSGPHRDCRR